MKLVTYAIAAYNHEKFVRESLEGVWNDDYPSKEIVIVDDGSSDRTAEVVRNWCTEKGWTGIKFYTGPNAGITATLNKLIAASTGDYIRLVSSDDVLLPGSTKVMAKVLDSDGDAMAVFGDAILIDADGIVTAESNLAANGADIANLSDPRAITNEIITNWSVSGPVIMIRRSFYLNFGTYDASMLVDDWDLYLRIVSMSGLRFINAPVAKYRIHGSNTSKTIDTQKRISNLLSQSKAAEKNIELFQSKRSRDLLMSERYLLTAKIAYLSRRWVECGLQLLMHAVFRLKSHFHREGKV